MSHIERLKLLLFLVKDAPINYHVTIWMPHILLTLLHRSIHSLHAFYLATFVCVFTGLKFVRSRLELPGLELISVSVESRPVHSLFTGSRLERQWFLDEVLVVRAGRSAGTVGRSPMPLRALT